MQFEQFAATLGRVRRSIHAFYYLCGARHVYPLFSGVATMCAQDRGGLSICEDVRSVLQGVAVCRSVLQCVLVLDGAYRRWYLSKETYILSKETYILSKETYILSKETHILLVLDGAYRRRYVPIVENA